MRKYVMLFTLLLVSMAVMSQKIANNNNYISMWFGAGYSNLLHNIPGATPIGHAGGAFGVGYEYHEGLFLMNVGAEFSYLNSLTDMKGNFDFSIPAIDTEGEAMTYSYKFEKFNDLHSVGYMSVPVSFGIKTDYFYATLGAKVGIALTGSSQTVSDYRTTGSPDWAIDDFENMPDHYFWNYSARATSPMRYDLNVSGTAEVGWFLGVSKDDPRKDKQKTKYKLGIFAEYGFLSIHNSNSGGDIVVPNPENVSKVTVTPLFLATPTANYSINPLFVGVKFAILFELPKPNFCFCIDGDTKAKRLKIKKKPE